MTEAERTKLRRATLAKLGLRKREYYLTDEQHLKIKAFLKRLRGKHG